MEAYKLSLSHSMNFNLKKGQKVVIQLTDSNVFQGTYEHGTKHSIILINLIDLETNYEEVGHLHFYANEIISLKCLGISEKDLTDFKEFCSPPAKDFVLMLESEYERLMTMTQTFKYFNTYENYEDAINHISHSKNIGVVGFGYNFGASNFIDLLAISTWDQVYIFDMVFLGSLNLSKLKGIFENASIKKVGHNLFILLSNLRWSGKFHTKNVFDTQVADMKLQRKQLVNEEDLKKRDLSECLEVYFNFPGSLIKNVGNKRNVSGPLRTVLECDKKYTEKFILWANQFLPFRSLRIHYKALEITCHGIPWFAGWLAFMWIYTNASLVQMQINMLLGLILDVIFVALIKAYVRRRRPTSNADDMLGIIGPDKFSFPSGHASRAVFVAYFFIKLYPLTIFVYPPLLAWATSICMSRILLNRHHILDVVAGVSLGICEGWLLGLLWLSQDTSVWIWSSLSDEKLDGGEYHV
ncbi:hypothetical protein FQA39_LY12482 [Lamprigera yunnana]|nr:hypothetical protein FQA39_LY12482 [Lamprigera yunnana]